MTFGKILCPTDFSPGAQQAMRTAVRLAIASNAELVLVHAWYVPAGAFAGGEPYTFPPDVLQQMRVDADTSLKAAADGARELGAPRVSSQLLTGVPWDAIVRAAEDPAVGLIVIGTHGRTGIARVLVGSVAEMVVRHAHCSVLAVRPDSEPLPFRHALVPTDFSEPAQAAAQTAREIARLDGAAITLMHAIELPVAYAGEPPVPDIERTLDKQSCELLDKWSAELRQTLPTPVKLRSRIGRPGSETLHVLDADPTIDLVVLGSHGRTGIRRALMGSVAEKVVRHARCPVLVARKR